MIGEANLEDHPGIRYVTFEFGSDIGTLLVDPRCTTCARYARFGDARALYSEAQGPRVLGAWCSACESTFSPAICGFI